MELRANYTPANPFSLKSGLLARKLNNRVTDPVASQAPGNQHAKVQISLMSGKIFSVNPTIVNFFSPAYVILAFTHLQLGGTRHPCAVMENCSEL